MIFPFKGAKLMIPNKTGFDSALENSEYDTASEFITSTCIAFADKPEGLLTKAVHNAQK